MSSRLSLRSRLRLLVVLTRPGVAGLLVMCCATGVLEGRPRSGAGTTLALALVGVLGFLLFSVAVNDLADVEVDRVNLPGDPRRPLASGSCHRRDMIVSAVAGAVLALAGAAAVGSAGVLVAAGGLLLSSAYSLPPMRLAARGAVASMVLPAGYVAVPYLLGLLSARGRIGGGDLALLGALYLGFIGRVLLKDFRDVRGDTLWGKRTFLVRHGRRVTCVASGACWLAGSVLLAAALHAGAVQAAALGVFDAMTVVLLVALAEGRGWRRDERVIAALALTGRSAILLVDAGLTAGAQRWSPGAGQAVAAAVVAGGVVVAVRMLRVGPGTDLRVPAAWVAASSHRPFPGAFPVDPAWDLRVEPCPCPTAASVAPDSRSAPCPSDPG